LWFYTRFGENAKVRTVSIFLPSWTKMPIFFADVRIVSIFLPSWTKMPTVSKKNADLRKDAYFM